jgi:hypothetical protein
LWVHAQNKKPLLMIRRGFQSRVPSSSHLSQSKWAGISTWRPALRGTGCYGVIGPVPSTVLDKENAFCFQKNKMTKL